MYPLGCWKRCNMSTVTMPVDYGDDPWTKEAAGKLRRAFGDDSFIFSRTGSNAVTLDERVPGINKHVRVCFRNEETYIGAVRKRRERRGARYPDLAFVPLPSRDDTIPEISG